MATFQEQIQKAKKLNPTNLNNDLFKFIRSIESEIIAIEKNRIENQSKDINGNSLGFYSKATEILSKGRKKAGEPFNAYDTGDLLNNAYFQEVAGVLRFSSRSPHWADIQKSTGVWLSKDLFGLSDQELKALIDTRLLPFFLQNIKSTLEI